MKLVLRHSIVSQLEVSLIESRRFQGQKRAVKDKYENWGNVKRKASKNDQEILCVVRCRLSTAFRCLTACL